MLVKILLLRNKAGDNVEIMSNNKAVLCTFEHSARGSIIQKRVLTFYYIRLLIETRVRVQKRNA